jgi:hypothetical protein
MGWIGAGGGAAVEEESEWIEGRWREDIAAMMWRHAPFNISSTSIMITFFTFTFTDHPSLCIIDGDGSEIYVER